MQDSDTLKNLVVAAMEDAKAQEVTVLDLQGKTSLCDFMVIASDTSQRHLNTIAERVSLKAKEAGYPPLGVEGERESEWILVDLADVVVHVMLPATRAFYNLEKLWSELEPEF